MFELVTLIVKRFWPRQKHTLYRMTSTLQQCRNKAGTIGGQSTTDIYDRYFHFSSNLQLVLNLYNNDHENTSRKVWDVVEFDELEWYTERK
jgi:hypothetical protein